MTALLFLVIGVAMIAATSGRRDVAIGLFAVGFLVSVVWLRHHMTDPLTLSF
jgi:hypothetical protein